MKTKYIVSLLLLPLFCGCGPMKKTPGEQSKADAPVIVYKMKADYSQQVPVTLNAGKTQIVSFPDPSDLHYGGNLATPTKLIRGYWLDNRGITANSAFLKYTYREYAGWNSAPSAEKLYEAIADSDPFLEVYDCGKHNQFENLEKEVKKLIRNGFEGCVRKK